MAYRKTFIIRSLPEKRPVVGKELRGSIAQNLFENMNRARHMASAYRPPEVYNENPLGYDYEHTIAWLSFIYRQVFKDMEYASFCPIHKNHFMVRFCGPVDANEGIDKLRQVMARWPGLEIDIEHGG